MARVRCITMQKDEGLLLDAWLRYYGYLFGFDNLEVLDNGSGDSLTCSILAQFEAVGVTVHRQFASVAEFEAKGIIVARIIEDWDRTHAYDFALPCDIDEFLALFTDDGLSCRRDRIDQALDRLVGCEQALWLETSLFNVPSQPGWFHAELFPKGFLPSRSILSLDSGYHIPQSRLCEGTRRTDFTYLHYHNKPYALLQAHTRRKLAPRLDLNDLEALRNYMGAGAHMTKDLLMSREEYVHQFDRDLTLHLQPFPILMRALGAREPMIVGDAGRHDDARSETITLRLPPVPGGAAEMVAFDGRGYLDDHLDVASDNARSLPHYLYYGFQEGRVLRRNQPAGSPPA